MKKNITLIERIQNIVQRPVYLKNSIVATFAFVLTILISCSKNDSSQENPSSNTSTNTNANAQNIDLAFVEGGTFDMGSPAGIGDGDERPQHKVTLNSFKISKYEITNEQFAKFLTDQGNQTEEGSKWYQGTDFNIQEKTYTPKKGYEKIPVRFVTWNGAKAYAKWVGGRIPTEAEWEYAARGGKKSRGYTYSGSNDMNEAGWYTKNSGGRLHNVGEKKPNELGIYDMSGNVWEWTADWYGAYSKEAQTNPTGPAQGKVRVRRGASAFCTAHNTRSANRSTPPREVRHNLGFRVVFDVK